VNTELTEMDRESPEDGGAQTTPQRRPGRGGGALAMLALLVALAAAAGTGWMWWQDRASAGQDNQRLMQEIARLDAGDSALSLKLESLRDEIASLKASGGGEALAALQQRLESDRDRLGELERSIEEQLTLSRSLQNSTAAMHSRLQAAESGLASLAAPAVNAGRDLDLAEVDYLLRLANERLQLFSDRDAADQALALAESQLAALDNPAYLGVRQEIAAARRALARAQMPDYLQMAAELDGLQAQVPSLPFAGASMAVSTEAGQSDVSWWGRLKSSLAGLVTIRRSADDVTLSIDDKDYLRQRLWLQLEMAHLALMRRDSSGFRNALQRAGETLGRWFDGDADAVRSAGRALDELAAAEIDVDLPDISKPWNSLRVLRSSTPLPTPAPPSVGSETADAEEPASTDGGQ